MMGMLVVDIDREVLGETKDLTNQKAFPSRGPLSSFGCLPKINRLMSAKLVDMVARHVLLQSV